jgi:multimeric flavodoxin WrbA
MREHRWATDDWPPIFEKVLASEILVLAGPIWLGDNSLVMKKVREQLYGGSHLNIRSGWDADRPETGLRGGSC